jgi:hypothetical protein
MTGARDVSRRCASASIDTDPATTSDASTFESQRLRVPSAEEPCAVPGEVDHVGARGNEEYDDHGGSDHRQ